MGVHGAAGDEHPLGDLRVGQPSATSWTTFSSVAVRLSQPLLGRFLGPRRPGRMPKARSRPAARARSRAASRRSYRPMASSNSWRASPALPIRPSTQAASSQANASSSGRGPPRWAATACTSASGLASSSPRQRKAPPVKVATPGLRVARSSIAMVACSARCRSPAAPARRTRSGPSSGRVDTSPWPAHSSQAWHRMVPIFPATATPSWTACRWMAPTAPDRHDRHPDHTAPGQPFPAQRLRSSATRARPRTPPPPGPWSACASLALHHSWMLVVSGDGPGAATGSLAPGSR
jgi:hypothetical protein